MSTTFCLDILKMIHSAKAGDISLSLAYADLVEAIYLGEAKIDPQKPQWEERDYVLLSNPLAWPAFYVALKQAGFPVEAFLQEGMSLKVPGVEAAFKSPGQGLTVAYGMARSLQISKRKNRVFVFLDDEDLKNGQIWEAAMGIAHDRLDRVMVVCSHTGTAKLGSIQDKFEAFGWKVFKLLDGHGTDEFLDTLMKAKQVERQPILFLAPTILGKGIPFMEGKQQYRGSLFSEAEMQEALKVFKYEKSLDSKYNS